MEVVKYRPSRTPRLPTYAETASVGRPKGRASRTYPLLESTYPIDEGNPHALTPPPTRGASVGML